MDSESYHFDRLLGNVTYRDGVLETEKLMMKSPIATVYAAGKVYTDSGNVDMYVSVLPIVTSSIPTIAALAGGVVVGAVAWVANQIIEEPVSKMALRAYHLSGPIDKPSITEYPSDQIPEQVIIP